MYRLVPPSRTPLTLVIAIMAVCAVAAAIPGLSAQAELPAHADAAGAVLQQAQGGPEQRRRADDADVLGAERMFSAWMEGQMAYRGLPGIVAGVVSDQELVWGKGFGFADINAKLPMTPTTKFRMASHSKMFTAIAIMQLREEGKLRLDDPVAKYLTTTTGRSPSSSCSHTARACSVKPETIGLRTSSRPPTSCVDSTPTGRRRSRRRYGGSTPTWPTRSRG